LEEFLDGGTLADKLVADRMDTSDVVRIGGALISAVEHMASLGLVHRDLKPANIMFRADGTTPVVVDFGIVRDLSQPSLTQGWLNMGPGTPYYAAPEQLLNQKELIDWRTDQFALGVLLAESALGVHPYANAGESHLDTVKRVAARNGPSKEFQVECQRVGLPLLTAMVAPWPVQRIRSPQSLRGAWTRQTNP
jgi:serine/threonine protein kinase